MAYKKKWFLIILLILTIGVGCSQDNGTNLATSEVFTDTPKPLETATSTQTSTQTVAALVTLPVSETPAEAYPLITPTGTISFTVGERNFGEGIFAIRFTRSYSFMALFEDILEDPQHIDLNKDGIGNSFNLEFSHYFYEAAFWTLDEPGELWISDISFNQSKLIYIDYETRFPVFDALEYYPDQIQLRWSADDSHLFIKTEDISLIYNLDDDTLEYWDYNCSRLAVSPNSGKVATWCESIDGKNEYAVIEWVGDIWFSENPPSQVLVDQEDNAFPTWSWSQDGERIAFYDPNDPQGLLYLANNSGEIETKLFSNSAFWITEEGLDKERLAPYQPPIRWSFDGTRLLIFANGSETNPCPVFHDTYLTGKSYNNVPCWQVFDIEEGKIIWTVSDTDWSSYISVDEISPWKFNNAIISPNGKYLVIQGWLGIERLFMIDLETNQIVSYHDFMFDKFNWNYPP